MSRNVGLYNERYKSGYMANFSDLAEADRLISVQKSARRWLGGLNIGKILDYGCGQGRYFHVWRALFPAAELYGAEVSDMAISLILQKYPEMNGHVFRIEDNEVMCPKGETFDLVVSIEVLEHVDDIYKYLNNVFPLLREGGCFLWTTPCANAWSLEWFAAIISGGMEPTAEGFRRYRWEDPSHLRRLKTKEIKRLLKRIGYRRTRFNFRTHLFGTLAYQIWLRLQHKERYTQLLASIAHLDFRLFRHLPNSASMIGLAQK